MLNLIKSNKIEFALILIGSFLFIHTYIGSSWASHYSADPVGTALIPRLYLVILVVCSSLILISKQRKPKEILNSDDEEEEQSIPSLTLPQTVIFYLFALTTMLYIYATWYIGLFVSTLVFLLVWLSVFGNKLKKAIIISIIGTTAIYVLMRIAQVYFPDGLLI